MVREVVDIAETVLLVGHLRTLDLRRDPGQDKTGQFSGQLADELLLFPGIDLGPHGVFGLGRSDRVLHLDIQFADLRRRHLEIGGSALGGILLAQLQRIEIGIVLGLDDIPQDGTYNTSDIGHKRTALLFDFNRSGLLSGGDGVLLGFLESGQDAIPHRRGLDALFR